MSLIVGVQPDVTVSTNQSIKYTNKVGTKLSYYANFSCFTVNVMNSEPIINKYSNSKIIPQTIIHYANLKINSTLSVVSRELTL